MTATSRDVLERLRATLAANDREGFADLMAPDGVLEWPFRRDGVPARLEGREAIREYVVGSSLAKAMRFQDLRLDAVHETRDPELIIAETTTLGSVLATGRRFRLPAIAVLTIRDGRIAHYRDYVNPLAAPAAVGAE